MKQDKDWTNVVRNALRDVEVSPPEGGWSRLERELKVPPRRFLLRTYWPRFAAAAAAVLISVAAGEFLWRADLPTDYNGAVIASAADGGTEEILSPAMSQAITQQPVATLVEQLRAELPEKHVAAAERVGTQVVLPIADSVQSALLAQHADQSEQPEAQPVKEPAQQSAQQSTRRTPADNTARRTIFSDEPFVAHAPPRKQASFALFGGGGVAGSSGEVTRISRTYADMPLLDGSTGTMPMLHDYGASKVRHYQPISFGLSVRKEFAHGLSLESGVLYSLLLSDVDMPMGANLKQELHFIGVPLRVNWNFFERRRFLLYMGAGGMVEKCVSAKFGSKSVDESRVQWSLLGALGAEYRLGGMVGLYFEPEVSYYLTNTQLRTVRTDSPLTVTLRLGVRLSF